MLCRWLNADSVNYLNIIDINGTNLYQYCSNNPVMYVDPDGNWDWGSFWRTTIDVVVTVATAAVAVAVGVVVGRVTNPLIGVGAGIATFSALNNITNSIYYNYFSNDESKITNDSYQKYHINRWDRLDYAKKETKQETYNSTVWMYYSEYSLHMYGWYLLGWAYDKNIPNVSEIANSASSAEINVGEWDDRWQINLGIIIIGILGL